MAWHKVYQLGKFTAAVTTVILPILILISYIDRKLDVPLPEDVKRTISKTPSFLINTTNCKIPNLHPFNSDVLPFIEAKKYEACSDKPLLSYIERKNDLVTLKINQSVIPLYTRLNINCCYSKILRIGDRAVNYSRCEEFHEETNIFYPSIRVTCSTFFGVIYQNVHYIVSPHFKNISYARHIDSRLKIFMLGIDSISRLSLQRTMPKVFSYLEKNFISFKGYNKIEDNTFPNLMAILTGRSMNTLNPICLRNLSFDRCDIIWKRFKENGFLTAYGEDDPYLNTFNYEKKGFVDPPTDFYMRPYFLSAYSLPLTFKHLTAVCSGPENTANRILSAAKEFLTVFKNDPTFSMFWLNSFSHDDINLPSSMDDKILEFLTDVDVKDSLKDSVFIMFSDHGFRFGDIRLTYSGWLEERLPFLYFKFPKTFQDSHPKFYENILHNAHNRLTNPYDFYMTLQHLLKLSNDSYDIKPSLGCPSCKSLFEKVQETRSCRDGSIEHHWCTCEGYNTISNTNKVVLKLGHYLVAQLHKIIRSCIKKGWCVEYELNSVHTVGKSNRKFGRNNSWTENYLIIIETKPYAMFEATIKVDDEKFELLGDISRLNKYGPYNCVGNDILMKFCVCNHWYTKIVKSFCYLFRCC